MSIEIDNQTPYDIVYVGNARLGGDGYTQGEGKTVPPRSKAEGAKLTKGGGTDGLWMLAGFKVPGAPQNLIVWCTMPAAAGGQVAVTVCYKSFGEVSVMYVWN